MKKILVTHNGTFHADEVFAVASFLMANGGQEAWDIVRSRDENVIEKASAVIDVGAIYDIAQLRFDHHQHDGAGIRPNGIPYASFGLVWNIYGEIICGDKKIADEIEKKIVLSIDAHDNGIMLNKNIYEDVHSYEISDLISDFNITWREEEVSEDDEKLRHEVFVELITFATKVINRLIIRTRDKYLAYDFVAKAYDDAKDKRVIIFDRHYSWKGILVSYTEPLFVIYPNPQGNWSVQAVPENENSFESRRELPESWAGKRDEDLANVSGVSDALFCHNSRFLAIAKSKEGALALVRKALD